MKIGLHDAEKEHFKHKTFPNYALMKISAFYKTQGDSVEWWQQGEQYDKVYSSKIFDFTKENPNLPKNTIKGGTGYDLKTVLPQEIENMFPDYSIYPECNFAIGYITRGCPNKCPWCLVPAKEGTIKPYRTWRQLIRYDTNKIVLMDNNILASNYGIGKLESMIGSSYKIDLNQGMDARLVTPEIADILCKLNWIRYIRFSCDSIGQISHIDKVVKLFGERGLKPYKIMVYVLVRNDLENADFRVSALKKHKGIRLYAQAERNERMGIIPSRAQLEFANRYVYGGSFRKESWKEYLNRRPYLKF